MPEHEPATPSQPVRDIGSPAGPRGRAGFALLIVGAVFFIYWPALRGAWLWDDTAELAQNPEITGAGGLARIWWAPSQADYLPLKSTVLWLAWRVFGENVLGYHVLGVMLHALAALLFWRVLARLGLRAAALGGLWFAVHPLAVESVAWIAELKNTLALPPLLLACDAYLRFAERGRRADYISALGWFLASLLCKASGVMLPAVFLLYHLTRNEGRLSGRQVWATLPFFVVSLAVGLVTIHFQATRAIAEAVVPIGNAWERLGQAGAALAFYAGKFVLPLGLLPIYGAGQVSSVGGIASWLALALLLGAAWRYRANGGRAVLLGLGAFVLLALPVLGFVPMAYLRYAAVADHFVYLPLLGLTGLAAAAVGRGMRQQRTTLFVPAATLAIIAVLVGLSRAHAARFRDQRTLWSYTLAHNPGAWAAHNNLGLVLAAAGDPAAALPHYEAALRLQPELVDARCNLGNALIALGRPVEAIAQFRAALARNPRYAPAHNSLGVALRRAGARTEAIRELEAALQLQPDYAQARSNLGNTLLDLGRAAEAVPQYEAALRLDPRFALAHYNLAVALRQLGRTAEAHEQHELARQLDPSLPPIAF